MRKSDNIHELTRVEAELAKLESDYARDLGAISHVLAEASCRREAALAALDAYSVAHARVRSEVVELREAIARKQAQTVGFAWDTQFMPAYLQVSNRDRLRRAEERFEAAGKEMAEFERAAAEARAEADLFESRWTLLRQTREPAIIELRRLRAAILIGPAGSPPRGNPNAVSAPGEVFLPDKSATVGRSCHRCGAPVPPGRRRFCSRDCKLAYRDEHGTYDDPKQSRFYDYGSHDDEEDRWDAVNGIDLLDEIFTQMRQ